MEIRILAEISDYVSVGSWVCDAHLEIHDAPLILFKVLESAGNSMKLPNKKEPKTFYCVYTPDFRSISQIADLSTIYLDWRWQLRNKGLECSLIDEFVPFFWDVYSGHCIINGVRLGHLLGLCSAFLNEPEPESNTDIWYYMQSIINDFVHQMKALGYKPFEIDGEETLDLMDVLVIPEPSEICYSCPDEIADDIALFMKYNQDMDYLYRHNYWPSALNIQVGTFDFCHNTESLSFGDQ